MSSVFELQNLELNVQTHEGASLSIDVVELEMFLQDTIHKLTGDTDRIVTTAEIVPLVKEWFDKRGETVNFGETWQIIQAARKLFEEGKKKLGERMTCLTISADSIQDS